MVPNASFINRDFMVIDPEDPPATHYPGPMGAMPIDQQQPQQGPKFAMQQVEGFPSTMLHPVRPVPFPQQQQQQQYTVAGGVTQPPSLEYTPGVTPPHGLRIQDIGAAFGEQAVRPLRPHLAQHPTMQHFTDCHGAHH
jgi:hypothetical protein